MTIPSPNSSPSVKPSDLTSNPSRKRQRSLSMQSDASSSSLKRTVGDGSSHDSAVRSPRTDQMSTLTLADPNHDIDAYMAEQGEADIPNVVFMNPHPIRSTTAPQWTSPLERVSLVEKGKSRHMHAGETWYIVSRDWWKRWIKGCTGVIDKEGSVSEQEIGPVNNAGLLDEYGNLRLALAEGVDVEFVPEDIWSLFTTWYGEASNTLPRKVIERGASKQTSLELRPPRLKAMRLSNDRKTVGQGTDAYVYLTISAGETMKTLCTRLAELVALDSQKQTAYRVWRVDNIDDDQTALEVSVSFLSNLGGKIVNESGKTLEEEGIQSDDPFIVEFKQPNGWAMDSTKSVNPLTVVGRPGAPAPLFNSNESFFNRMGNATSSSSTSVATKSADDYFDALQTSSWKTSAARKEKGVEPGTMGLGNMGNTCFMNSALQCLAHNKELTDYFLTGLYREELNPDNPLGMHGAIAEAFGALLQRIWAPSGTSTSYTPRDFKSQLQRFAPQFSGYQQHDSQELVAFLLDGLHEDLNRVLKKPYVEKPDWEGGGDVELVQLAQKSWEGYMMRNDSVIVDLFQGQYQSTLICPECEKVSITFDPFMYLTLPLPIQKKWKHTIFYVPWDHEKPHVKVPVEISRDASFKDLRALLGRWMGAPPDNLLTLEIFSNKFYKNLDDNLLCGDMADNDTIVCFELPCHAQQSRTYKKQPNDPMIVPMYLCDVNSPTRNSYLSGRNNSLFGYPLVVAITPEQATSVSTMYEAALDRLQRWTSNSRDLFTWEAGPASDMDEVPITLNGFPPTDRITEIKGNGDVVTVHELDPLEGDIVDEKSVIEDNMGISSIDMVPHKIGTKKDIFTLRLQANHKEYGTQHTSFNNNYKWESWDRRIDNSEKNPVLLREGDAFYCEFDENMKAYYFGEERSHWEHARWDTWEEFIHPEYAESKKAAEEKKHEGISLQDCLDEFTKEEKLGEDDLWYCPRCKKHQQATKKFDLWKVPDILVVHLKRFSNSRTLRDKIDTFIDFPVEGLDLSDMVGEREVAKRLVDQGLATEQLHLGNLDEPLVYDLFGVDEHMGGLGGGHYRAYTLNYPTDKWHHFDDSYVTPARASDAVNANAYLLFYRRRTTTPLGGKTHQKIEEARARVMTNGEHDMTIDTQLPTPPNETNHGYLGSGASGHTTALSQPAQPLPGNPWEYRSKDPNAGSSPSPDDPPGFEESQSDELLQENPDPLLISSDRFEFPDPSGKSSPTSSNEAEADPDTDTDDITWEGGAQFEIGVHEASPSGSTDWQSGMGSPSSSTLSDTNLFSDVNVQKHDDAMDTHASHDKTA